MSTIHHGTFAAIFTPDHVEMSMRLIDIAIADFLKQLDLDPDHQVDFAVHTHFEGDTILFVKSVTAFTVSPASPLPA